MSSDSDRRSDAEYALSTHEDSDTDNELKPEQEGIPRINEIQLPPPSGGGERTREAEAEVYDDEGYNIMDLGGDVGDIDTWSLPRKLAKHFDVNERVYLPSARLSEMILDEYPPPGNIIKDRKMDEYMKNLINANRRHAAEPSRVLARDKDLKSVWDSVRDVMGPLGFVWYQAEEIRKLKKAEPGENHILDTEMTCLVDYYSTRWRC